MIKLNNNICYLHNIYDDRFEKYFDFTTNIMAVNCIETDIQDRANGMDSITGSVQGKPCSKNIQ